MSQSSVAPIGGAAPAQGDDDSGGEGGFVIVLAFQADGSIQIAEQGAAGDDGGGGSDGGGNITVDSLDEAFQAVAQIAEQSGYQDGGDGDESGGNSGVGAGASSGATPAASGDEPLSPGEGKALWNKLAAKRDRSRGRGV